VKLFFCAVYFLIVAVAFSGCGSEAGDSGQNYSAQMMENTIRITADQSTVLKQQEYEEQVPKSGNVPSEAGTPQRNSNLEPIRTVANNVHLGKENIGGLSETQLDSKLEDIASKTDIDARDAYLNDKTWTVVKGKDGRALNIDIIKKAVLSAKTGKQVKISYTVLKPKVTEAQLKGKIKTLAKCSTTMLDRSKPRVYNIRLAAKKLDYAIVLPGDEFSFNNRTGSKSKKMGYKDATVIVKTPKGPEHKKAPGGGVCQLSTTVYNAVLRCGLKVSERHEHSDDVHYVPKGKDATVTYKGADFKFINNRQKPIMIRAYVGKKTVSIHILERE